MKILPFILFVLTWSFVSETSAQNVGGEWYGVGTVKKTGSHNSYLSEMILKQKGNTVTGEFNYFYRSVEIKTKVTGKYDPKFKVLELNARPILNFLAKNENGADCPMEGSFTLKITNGKATLTGQLNPTYDYRITCPAIDIKFTKALPAVSKPAPVDVETEDAETTSTAQVKKPALVNNTDTIKKTVAPNQPVSTNKNDTSRSRAFGKTDTAKKPVVIVRPPIIHKPISEEQQKALILKQRVFDITPVIDVDADSLKVSLYDNGEVDYDTISLFYNRKMVATKQLLSDKALSITLPLDYNVNEISMFAENLGRIPPNTALAIIYAGEQRFELNLTSTLIKNAAIRFRRKVKHVDPRNIN